MRVLISGAGIAGPTLAWWLSRLGHHITIVDISSDFLAQGQNIDLSGAAITIAKRMGIEKRIKELNTTEKGTHIIDEDERILARFDATENGLSPTSPYEILRGDLAMILADATKDHPNVEYRFNTTVKEVISNDEDSVKVELSNGEQCEYDMVVAADGQWSLLRKKCFDSSDLTIVDKNMYVTYFTVPRIESDVDYWQVSVGLNRRGVSNRPDPHGTLRAMLTIMPTTPEQKEEWEASRKIGREAQIALLKRDFADVGGKAPRFLEAVDSAPDFYMQGVKQIRMKEWSAGRVVLLGDAAYAPTPLTGMGTSLAIIGAYVLAGQLSKLQADEHPRAAFESYDKEFRPFVEKIQQIPAIAPGIFHPTSSWQRWLLQTGIAAGAKFLTLPGVSRWLSDAKGPEANDDGFPMPVYSTLEVF